MAFVIFGTKGVNVAKGSGRFYCPRCSTDRAYRRMETKRRGHIYFLPIVPLGTVGEYIECTACGGQFDAKVLELPTKADLDQLLGLAVRSAVMAIIRADDVVTERERKAGTNVVSTLVGGSYNRSDLDRDLAGLDSLGLLQALTSIGPMLTDAGKAQILEACVLIAASDGVIEKVEIIHIERVATALGVPASYVPGIIQTTLSKAAGR